MAKKKKTMMPKTKNVEEIVDKHEKDVINAVLKFPVTMTIAELLNINYKLLKAKCDAVKQLKRIKEK